MSYRTAVPVLAWLGIALLAYAGYAGARGALYQRRAETRLAHTTVPLFAPASPAPTPPGGLLGEIEIPRLGLHTAVIEGDSNAILRLGAGHVPGTAFPWQIGNFAIAAHRDTYFRQLKDLRIGDEIDVATAAGRYQYQVTFTRIVAPNEVSVLLPTPSSTLTLITCYPFYYVGPAPQRFIVRAGATRH